MNALVVARNGESDLKAAASPTPGIASLTVPAAGIAAGAASPA